MIEAGLSVVTALVILEQQTDDDALRTVIDEIREQVETGALLSEAMAQASGRLLAPLHRDGRGRRGRRRPRHRARPRRDPDREGAADQAPRQGRDDLPDGRAHVRDARDDGHADVPRPDLRQDLRPARRRPAEAHPVRALRVECAAPSLVPGDPDPGRRVHRRRRRRRRSTSSAAGRRPRAGAPSGMRSSCGCRCRSDRSCSRCRWRAGRAPSRR